MCPDIMKFILSDDDTDINGYLMNLDDWSDEIANNLSIEEEIELNEKHWEIIHFLREYYREYGSSPNVRLLMKVIGKELGAEKGNRKYLYDLFPKGPSRQGCKIAGLPLPNDCIDNS
jgi:tRNA 2-thiouridine synthesizing protein E